MKKFIPQCIGNRGIALVVVLALMALLVLMAVAVLSVSESDLKAARIHSDGQEARQLSEVAVNIVMSQLKKATAPGDSSTGPMTWISQPGLLRRYSLDGLAKEAYKLYSSSNMILRNPQGLEADLMAETPGVDWNKLVNKYVDLNSPVTRVNSEGNPVVMFPIIDPRAMSENANSSVGGFSYQQKTINGSLVSGVVMTGGLTQRLPMPVEWIYLLKDGSMGVLNEDGLFVGSGHATRDNPMVGRIAFWTDDEACKININTASEPTAWSVPTFTHQQDGDYAQSQPVNGEFQRYPGHPATTALSPVLFPGQQMNVALKESIYQIIPKIAAGGSMAGTRKYFDLSIAAVALGAARRERLFASVDELLLGENRTKNELNGQALSPDLIQKASFFLTTSSRAPETNPFGLPKVAIWPVSYRGNDFRTAYDQLMAHCSTLHHDSGSRSYIFQRGWADSLNNDIEKTENAELLLYLKRLLSKTIPGFADGSKANFARKYGNDLPQLLVEIFDYIRSTNLCDGNLVKDSEKMAVGGMTNLLGYAPGSTRRTDFKTFTDPLNYASSSSSINAENGLVEGNGYPGYGQTTPSRWKHEGLEVQGIGRFPTISEVGLHFICCADNTEDDENPHPEVYPFLGKPGGRGAPRKDVSGGKRWFSNFPPRPKPNPAANEAPDFLRYPKTEGYPYGADKMHPGYQKMNWNHQLEPNKPLRTGVRRVQARILLEFFVPAAGFPQIQPELTIRVRGLRKLKLNDQHLFPNDEEFLWTGSDDIRTPNNIRTGGHGLGITSLIGERFLPERFPMPADNGWGGSDWIIKPSEGVASENFCAINHDLVSNFIDVDVGVDGSRFMNLSGSSHASPIQIEIWSGHYGRKATSMEIPAQLVQTLHVPIPAALLPPPTLIRNSLGKKLIIRSTENPEPVAFWTFYSKGALGFNVDSLKKASPHPSRDLMGGRFYKCNGGSSGGEPTRSACIYGYDYPDPGVSVAFIPRSGVKFNLPDLEKAENIEGCDVVQSVQIAHGDYRLTAALPVVPADAWAPHRYYGKRRLAHNFRAPVAWTHPGFDYGLQSELNNQLVSLPRDYNRSWKPDLPRSTAAGSLAQRYGDFDNIVWNPDGPYINKPDEGNLVRSQSGRGQIAYFNLGARSMGKMFFSPNRMISSPVMFGSLPSGVQGRVPWRTLLFRPQDDHYGAAAENGGTSPPDHLFLEFFWMPVVEPYAISGPISTAGKINMNYQMFPFTHIHRSTGMHAVLAGTQFAAIPATDANDYKIHPTTSNVSRDVFWTQGQGKVWHHEVDVEKTLRQFDARFASCKAFVHPSEICSIYLIPKNYSGSVSNASLKQFWKDHRLTGDNVRERPYAGIYPRITTRSNVFRVHCITQTIKKSRSSPADKMGVDDRVTGEYQGSALVERYLDPSHSGLPDFGDPRSSQSLDSFYNYRVLESKRFGY
jgi:Tfp pilus assembly protein PilX